MKNCPEQHPIDFSVRWAYKPNRENSHSTAYQRHCFANHRMMICVLLMVVFFTVCTTIDWEVRILERPLSRTMKNELLFLRSCVPSFHRLHPIRNALTHEQKVLKFHYNSIGESRI